MVRNSPCSVCFLTLKPFRLGGKDLFVVCLVSMGWSLLVNKFLPNLLKTNSENKLHKTDYFFDHFLVFVLFCLIVFYSKEDFLVALTLCSRPIFRALFQTYGTWAVKKSVKITWSFSVFSQRRP